MEDYVKNTNKQISELKAELELLKSDQTKIIHKQRRLGNDVVHVKKETGITLLGEPEKPTTVNAHPPAQPSAKATSNGEKKRPSTSSNTAPPETKKKKI